LQQGTGIPVDNIEDRKTPSVGQLASMAFRRPEENQIGNQRYLHLFPSIATDTHSPLGWDEMFFPPFLQPVTHGQLMSFPGTGRKPADTFFNHRQMLTDIQKYILSLEKQNFSLKFLIFAEQLKLNI
jgi:hypothetical protein